MNRVTIHGVAGAIQWGYHRAASVGAWMISATGATGTLTGSVSEADSFRLEQPGLKFCVPRQTGAPFEWDVESLLVADGQVTATVRMQE